MSESFIVISGTPYGERRQLALSAPDALQMVLDHMRLRRRGVRIEDRNGNPVTYFELKSLAESEKLGSS